MGSGSDVAHRQACRRPARLPSYSPLHCSLGCSCYQRLPQMKTSDGSASFAPALFPLQEKQRMADRRALKLLTRGFHRDAKVATEGVAVLDLFSQNEGRLPGGQFPCVDRFSATPAREGGLTRRPQVAHPAHCAEWGAQIA